MAMNNTQFDAIMRKYDKLQLQHQYELSKRFDEVYAKIPEYKTLEESIPTVSMSYTRRLLDGDAAARDALKAALAEISSKKKQLLLQNGFPEDYLEMQYNCPACKDTGYIGGEKCFCLKKQILSVSYEQSNIAKLLETDNFSTLSEEYYEGEDLLHFREAVALCHNIVDNFESNKENLLLYGSVGVGKSFLSCCIAKELLDKGYSVLYFSSSHLFDVLAENDFRKDSKENLYTSKEDIYNCDLVVIDDLGTEITNSFVFTSLFSLITERILRNKSTIISTNLTLKHLMDLYSDRIFSRITAKYKLCKLSGPDIRIDKKTASIRK